ncbi:MAG: septum formation initiator family protein [Firmicutes bacterium]|nr:septum formation initiator family protein [Bacillota bacterium]
MRDGSPAASPAVPSAPPAAAPRPRRVRRWRWRRTLVATVTLYALLMFARQEWMLHRLRVEEERYQQQLAQIEEHNAELRRELQDLQSLPAIEMQARKMGLTKPGEIVYEPVPAGPNASEAPPAAAPGSR